MRVEAEQPGTEQPHLRVARIELDGGVCRGEREPGCTCSILHLAQRTHQHSGLRILRERLVHQVVSLSYFLLSQEYFHQTRDQCGIVRLLLKLRLVENNSSIVITVQEGVFSL